MCVVSHCPPTPQSVNDYCWQWWLTGDSGMTSIHTARDIVSANTRHSPNAVLMLGQRRRRWTNIKTALERYLAFARVSTAFKTEHISHSTVRSTQNLINAGPTLQTLAQHWSCDVSVYHTQPCLISVKLSYYSQIARSGGVSTFDRSLFRQIFTNVSNLRGSSVTHRPWSQIADL